MGWEVGELPSEVLGRWREEFMKTSPAALGGLAHSASTQVDRSRALARLDVPALVVVGEEDAALGEEARKLEGAVPGAQVAVIAGAGHSLQISRAEDFNELVLAFLKRAVPVGRGG